MFLGILRKFFVVSLICEGFVAVAVAARRRRANGSPITVLRPSTVMGYTTDFEGFFTITPPLDGAPKALLYGLCNTRRMARETDPIYGVEGEYCVKEEGRVLDRNRPPRTQPSLNCDWKLSDDGAKLQWSGMEKFYGYTEWLRYIVTRVIPEGTVLNGEVKFAGESAEDKGMIRIVDNRIRVIPHCGEQLQSANLDPENLENLCKEVQSAVLLILQSLEHYRNHHDWTLGLPLKVDYYISYMLDVDRKLNNCTLPPREWITGQDGDVTQAVYFSVLLNPNLLERDVQTALSAYNNIFGIENNGSLPKASLVQEFWKASSHYIKTTFRSPWRRVWAWNNSWVNLQFGNSDFLRELRWSTHG